MIDDVCPTCQAHPAAPLTAAADVLVLRALERIANHLLRADRSRYRLLGGRPRHEAHVLWQPDPAAVDQALGGAWQHVGPVLDQHGPVGADVDEVRAILDRYVRDLLAQQAPHDPGELTLRLRPFRR